MPDLIADYHAEGWLLLIEAVTSHGPVTPKRRKELKGLFQQAKSGLVFVTAFLTHTDLKKYFNDIARETEAWAADHPTHLVRRRALPWTLRRLRAVVLLVSWAGHRTGASYFSCHGPSSKTSSSPNPVVT